MESDELQQATPLLTAFPDLHICLQARAMVARIFNLSLLTIAVDFSYRQRDHTMFLNHQGNFTGTVFGHELGHHVNSYFSEQDWLALLGIQKWLISKREIGETRIAPLEDLAILRQEDDPTKPPEHEWTLFNPVYDEDAHDWVEGREYAHTNPEEMVAEIFVKNYKSILEYARSFRGTDQQRQRGTIKYLLSKIPAF